MNYPTLEEVKAADRIQLARWYRFLDSPGMKFVGTPKFEQKINEEVEIMNFICDRFKDLGGFTSEISKAIGWGS